MKYPTLRNGNRGAVTPAQLSKLKMSQYSQEYSDAGTSLTKQVFTRVPADYTADGSLYYITMDHNLNSPFYTFSVVKLNNNTPPVIEDIHQGDNTLTLWFHSDTLTLAITIIG